MSSKNNLLTIPEHLDAAGPEFFETILRGPDAIFGRTENFRPGNFRAENLRPGNFRVERIISHGHTTPAGQWYDQEQDEWVMVLQGEAALAYADGSEIRLVAGEHLFLPRHCKHRVSFTSSPCIWLAVHGDGLRPSDD